MVMPPGISSGELSNNHRSSSISSSQTNGNTSPSDTPMSSENVPATNNPSMNGSSSALNGESIATLTPVSSSAIQPASSSDNNKCDSIANILLKIKNITIHIMDYRSHL